MGESGRSRVVEWQLPSLTRQLPWIDTIVDATGATPFESDEELAPITGYDAWAPSYDDDGNPLTALEEPAARAWYGDVAGRRVVDVGCGTGRHTAALLAAGAMVVGLEPSRGMLARARAKLTGGDVVWIRHAFPAPLPFLDAQFDLAMLGLVAEHLDDLAEALRELARICAPGGRLILSALHPDRTAAGQRARFIDPATGLRRPLRTIHRRVDDYLDAARDAGWTLIEQRALIADAGLAARLPRAARYVDQNLGWIGHWKKT